MDKKSLEIENTGLSRTRRVLRRAGRLLSRRSPGGSNFRHGRPPKNWCMPIGMVFMLGACGSSDERASHPYVSEEMRAEFGTIGVVSALPLGPDDIEVPPSTGEAIVDGMLLGALEGGGALGGGVGGMARTGTTAH